MEQRIVCPICKREYDSGVEYCEICLTPIQSVKGSWENDDPDESERVGNDLLNANLADSESSINHVGSAEPNPDTEASSKSNISQCENSVRTTQCPECGTLGIPGNECVQCGHILAPKQEAARRSHVILTLPDGAAIEVTCGREVVIGRESPDACIANGLERFSAISRKHCNVVLNEDGSALSVQDLGSLNGTWVEGRDARLADNETAHRPIPTRIRLGSRLYISFE